MFTLTLTNKQVAKMIRQELAKQGLQTATSFVFDGGKTSVKVKPATMTATKTRSTKLAADVRAAFAPATQG